MSSDRYRIHLKGYEAVILYPALVTPAIVAKDIGCMTLVLATKMDFYDAVHLKDTTREGSKIGKHTARKFHSQLSFVKFGGGDIFNLTEFAYVGNQRNLTATQNMIYADHNAALQRHHDKDYQGWYLGKIDGFGPVQGYDADGGKKLLGRLSPWAVNMYKERGFTELFQLNFKKFDALHDHGMYEVAFTFFNKFDNDDIAGEHTMNNRDITDADISEGEGKKFCYTDPDCPVCKQNGKVKKGAKHKMYFQPPSNEDFGNEFIQTRHPVYIPEKWTGKIGVLGDLHISSRQAVYKLVRPQVIPGANVEDSPAIGDHIHESIQSAQWLMNKMGKVEKCDLLAIVGDIFDHVTNLDPAYCLEKLEKGTFRTTDLWGTFNKPEYLYNFDIYPQYIDLMQFLSLVVDYYKKAERPIVAVNGNHEAYSIPYGISPYIGSDDWELVACNAGIPSDHNLPRYDATLLYGPGFGSLGVNVKLGWNFKPKCFDVFYCLLTPWSDFAFAYEGRKQEDGTVTGRQDFLTFGWGNSEKFIRPFLGRAGTLPRASNNFDHYQAQMLADWTWEKEALNWTKKKKGEVLLLSHFPFASYDPALPLNDKNAWVNSHMPSKYDWGSFNSPNGYAEVFEGKIDYTLSGHTHRPAVYTPQPSNTESYKPTARYKDPGKTVPALPVRISSWCAVRPGHIPNRTTPANSKDMANFGRKA